MQFVHAMFSSSKSNMQQMNSNTDILTVKDHHITKNLYLSQLTNYTQENRIPLLLQIQNINLNHKFILVNFFQMKS